MWYAIVDFTIEATFGLWSAVVLLDDNLELIED